MTRATRLFCAAVRLCACAAAAAACSSLETERVVDRIRTPIANPSFAADIAPVLRETCGSSGACHGGAAPQQGLLLEGPDSVIRANIVNVLSAFYGGLGYMRVRPGVPDSSYLLLIMSETTSVRLGYPRRMPLTELPMPQPVRTTIRNWIANGAPAN